MTALVQAALRVRRTARSMWGLAVALLLGAFVVGGFFLPGREVGWAALSLGAIWIVAFAIKARDTRAARPEPQTTFEAAALLLVGCQALVQLRGGVSSELYPLTYVAVALGASFVAGGAGAAFVGFAAALDLGVVYFAERITDVRVLAAHLMFVLCFGLLNLIFTRAEILRIRRNSVREERAAQEKVRDETRLFRLVAPVSEGLREESRICETSVQEVHQALYHTLELLHETLGLQTCVLLMPGDGEEELHIAELITSSDEVADGPFILGSGAVGAAVRRRLTTSLQQIRPGYRGLCYYRGPAPVTSFVAVPIVEGRHFRAVLCADRMGGEPFNSEEEELLRKSTSHILRCLENERVFVQLERAKRQQEILYRGSRALSTALNQDDVMDVGLATAAEIAPHDFAAITEYQVDKRQHIVLRSVGEQADEVDALQFRDNASLTAMVVKNKHYLPYRGEFDAKQQVLFTKRAKIKGMESLLVLPLVVREEPVGTLIVASRAKGAFGESARETLQALANQLAVALANARAVRLLEQKATTDGLTGCLNKRAFLVEMEQKILAAQRFGRKLSLIVTDLDHFKTVNDTYGHAAGDKVLKELGELLNRVKRETDIVARFGGEEFCVLCEETDTRGAKLLAERVREELEQAEVMTELGPLNVTASLGVATFPDHAATAETLFAQSDRALYDAKSRGRNQVCTV